ERSETRDPGRHEWIALRDSCAGSRVSFRSRKRASGTRHEVRARFRARAAAAVFGETNPRCANATDQCRRRRRGPHCLTLGDSMLRIAASLRMSQATLCNELLDQTCAFRRLLDLQEVTRAGHEVVVVSVLGPERVIGLR